MGLVNLGALMEHKVNLSGHVGLDSSNILTSLMSGVSFYRRSNSILPKYRN